ncbi:PUA-like domain-containing protein [Phialemonium atrogriseum]|uniref:PUA-like domain-containing protein n=1 Tax=Phialemonium atrogriseum TaxID=1093897 RepID=A0AAJ0FLI1_9PEZI|nr:PUA-like domain-containing protein [Phialemonium atrogriseum]KAK1772212.1 PUA-like domain-containing protein [Phialemonium atrogriseum]
MSDQNPVTETLVIVVPDGISTPEFIRRAKLMISRLAVKYARDKGNPPTMTAEIEGQTRFLRSFIPWLETEVHMTPKLRDHTQIHVALSILFDPTYYLPSSLAEMARAAYNRFEAEKWGATSTNDGEGEGEEPVGAAPTATGSGSGSSAGSGMSSIVNSVTSMRLPPPDHPIWGRNGIMHGVAFKPGRRASYVLNSQYLAEKRGAKVFGHNGLEPGAWWPFQLVALFHGAHGASVKGIAGDAELGTWSVVLSGTYDDLDADDGDSIWYSGDGSHENQDPRRILHESNATRSLHTSLATGKPVRVLRGAKTKRAFAPTVGIRYDGLYRVVATRKLKNQKGGLYEVFRMERLPGQRSLDDICMTVPSPKQEYEFSRIQERY